mmetsp:Transcript_13808/g.26811  ORF Transcript_13808/g.26811 Transcript_13808/m.26811 type:complete len:196 (-) Transcript_13808:328-915(-)|eukprot:CAMPEP_0171515648 /NCGR_PEP_ID=MMETSP0959-20130129/3581_1 /TAXON_ID=87120 /ORGANISM="Aurantiochytrium limacinum, Strain ATCCMYA-1381" /LENGTH=195 /DNA_ID=CAMNT_0012054237 /DNA_START=110 /DNA_END=697 /DNA_ORIENTATION=-
MGLRSRKAGGRERQEARSDFEQQFIERADRPLQTLHVQTEAFNLMWRTFLFRLTCALVFFAAYAALAHKDNLDFAAFDALSAVFYGLSAAWLNKQESSFDNFTSDNFFRMSLIPLATQIGFFAFALAEQGRINSELIPMTLFYLMVVIIALRYMRGNATLIKESREDLLDLQNPSPSYIAGSHVPLDNADTGKSK